MSAYGPLSSSRSPSDPLLATTLWHCPQKTYNEKHSNAAFSSTVTIHHLTKAHAQDDQLPGLLDYLYAVFAEEVNAGLTYPQESVRDCEAFEAYFFAGDVFLAIAGSDTISIAGSAVKDGAEIELTVVQANASRPWAESVAGFYYVKPNYPGRSSHICNGGFVVPPFQRGSGFGTVLARSYLHYAPRLGYTASVFNLVYVNNVASVRLWENLGFVKAGLIPKAGRLKRRDGQPGEEYIDAYVFYKSFEEEAR